MGSAGVAGAPVVLETAASSLLFESFGGKSPLRDASSLFAVSILLLISIVLIYEIEMSGKGLLDV